MIKRYGVIYIGSNKCELVVGQRGKGGVNILDRAMYPIDLGSQTFARGKIDYASVIALSKIINDYLAVAKSSDVSEIDIVGTSALREARNRAYVLEQLRIFTGGHVVRLLTREEEVALGLRYMVFTGGPGIIDEKTDNLLSVISSGNITMAVAEKGKIVNLHHSDMGYLKMRELFRSVEESSTHYETLLSDYIAIRSRVIAESIGGRSIERLTIASHDVDVVAGLCGIPAGEDGCYHVPKKAFSTLRDDVEGLGVRQIMKKYPRLNHFQAETLRHTLLLYLRLMKEAHALELTLIGMNIGDALMNFKFNVTRDRELQEWIEESAYLSVQSLARKFHTDTNHTKMVEVLANRLFNALKGKYQMKSEDAWIMSLAAQLLDIGQFVGESDQGAMARDLISRSDIIGLGAAEKRVIGSIVYGVRQFPYEMSVFDGVLSPEESLRVSKLVAILKLAQTLDKSRKQKISKLRCHLDEKEFVVTATTGKNIQLEKYFFQLNRDALKKVFGLEAKLRIKRTSL